MMHLILLAVFLPVYAHEKSAAELHVMEYLQPDSVATPKSWTFPASYTGHRSVCWLPGATTNMSFVAWVGGDTYAPGEPFGFSRSPDTNGYYAVELTRGSPITPRINILSSVSDRGETLAEYYLTLSNRYVVPLPTRAAREQAAQRMQRWINTNRVEIVGVDDLPANGSLTRVRVVRWLVDGDPVYKLGCSAKVVFDKKLNLAKHPTITEADLLADGAFDIDWESLARDIDDADVTLAGQSVAYLVVIGDGSDHWRSEGDDETVVKVVDQVIERRFDASQAIPMLRSPISGSSIPCALRPAFSWTLPTTSYTAFRLQILPATGATNEIAAVYDSGIQPMPPRNAEDQFVWTAPLRGGTELAASTNYRWRVTALNARYPNPLWCEPATFSTSPAQ